MLQPKKRRYPKEFRGRMGGIEARGNTVAYGDFGLQAVEKGWVDSKQIESARKSMVNYTSRKGKIWIKIFPHKPVTKKSDEVVRGGGKGPVDHYVSVIKPGRVIFEIGGLDNSLSAEALNRAAAKLPIKCRVISKHNIV